jgi:hypothetical protein
VADWTPAEGMVPAKGGEMAASVFQVRDRDAPGEPGAAV